MKLSKGLLILLLYIFISACSTVQKDGPPPGDIDVSKIPDAVPKVEKLSKIGNKPYQVFGKKYSVMSSSKHYRERGVASWYGTKFHKRNTSSGERYDMLGMTAAHRNLPLPTYVEVTNLANGKRIIVKVNDRGPFESSRIIDLSYAAAKKIGMLGKGTANVEIRAIDPTHFDQPEREVLLAKHTFKKTTATKRTHSPVYLQVGAFRNKSYAEKLKKQLIASIRSPISIKSMTNRDNLYRVQIGPIKEPQTVERINKQLKSMGLNGRELV